MDFINMERKWQKFWKDTQIYRFDPDNPNVFSIDTPPRYASGILHIGHAVHYTHIDIIARYKRMRGYNVFFPLCFDVNGMPIEVNVEKKYNITMATTDRHEFIKLCEDFANSMITAMTKQYEILGESMDPSIYYQTNAPYYRKITQLTFLEMQKRGLVYKSEYPITWCPRCNTAIAESEIDYIERDTILNYIKFKVEDGSELVIATTRPELIPACVMVAVNPEDTRYRNVVNKHVTTPLFNITVKIIADPAVDIHFGTGAVMICTFGDKEDLTFVRKHGLELRETITEKGVMNERAGPYAGLTVIEARTKIIEDLKQQQLLIKQERIRQSVGTCWRCNTPIEIIQKKQWFLKTLKFKPQLLQRVENLHWYPEFMKKRLIDWIRGLDWDWVISRNRYFATPIPAWECENGHVFFPDIEELKRLDRHIDPTLDTYKTTTCPVCNKPLKGVEEVFDTWMDSSISPLFNTQWNKDARRFNVMYPMSLRPQGHDIIRTWAFYSLYRCTVLTDTAPWRDIFVDGYVLAPDGRPMHASWGNVIDPIEIIKKEGADPFRYFTAQCAVGEDTPFRFKEVVHGKRLINKLYNIAKFIMLNVHTYKDIQSSDFLNNWIIDKYSVMVKQVTEYMDNYRYDQALRVLENFVWHEFADHYLELIKFRIKDDIPTQHTLASIFLGLLKMFAPVLPHITEELYHQFYKQYEQYISIHICPWPKPVFENIQARAKGELVKEIIIMLRQWKNAHGIALSATINHLTIVSEHLDKAMTVVIKNTMHIGQLDLLKTAKIVQKIVKIVPNFKIAGPALKKHLYEFSKLLENTDPELIYQHIQNGWLFHNIKISKDFVTIHTQKTYMGKNVDTLEFSKGLLLLER